MSIRVEVKQVSATGAQASGRGHQVTVDRPLEKGGEDAGMMGGEYLLVALGGCFMSNLLAAILAREADVKDVRAVVTGTLAQNPSRFAEIELTVRAETADPALLGKLVGIADKGCIVANTLRGALKLTVRTEHLVHK